MKNILYIILSLLSGASLHLTAQNIPRPNLIGPNGVEVNTYNGNIFHQRQDIFIPGRGLDIDLTFSYNSGNRFTDRGFGRGWTFAYNMAYMLDTNGVSVEFMNGRIDTYTPDGSNLQPPAGIFDQLEEYQSNKYRLTTKSGMKYFFDQPTHQRLTKMEDRYGNTMTLAYTDSLLTQLTDASGRNIHFKWTGNRLTKITDPNTTPARTILFEYSPKGDPIKVTNPLGDYVEYQYADDGKLTAVIDENGNPVTLEYNVRGAVKKLITCVTEYRLTYNATVGTTYIVQQVSGENQMTAYKYDEGGRLVEKKGNCCGYNIKYEYDEDNNISKMTDANGNVYEYSYDDRGNMTLMTDPLGYTMVYAYEPVFNNITSITDKRGNTTTYNYDVDGNLVQINKPMGVVNSFGYDGFGQLVSAVDGNGGETTYNRDSFGNLTNVTDALNKTEYYGYDGAGRVISFTDKIGSTTNFEFDGQNRMTKIIDPYGATKEFIYDKKYNIVTSTNQLGNSKTFNYDAVDRLTESIDELGYSLQYEYNESNKLISHTDELGYKSIFYCNNLNRLTKEVNPIGEIKQYDYDYNGNMTIVFPTNGNNIELIYDGSNQLIQAKDMQGILNEISYDPNGNIVTVHDGENLMTISTYDELNRLIKEEDALGYKVEYLYDSNDNLIKKTDKKGNYFNYSFDSLNRLKKEITPLGDSTIYGYDYASNLTSIVDPNGNIYGFELDKNYKIKKQTYPDGSEILKNYDPIGNLISKIDNNGNTTEYEYDLKNRLVKKDYPGSNDDEYVYDPRGSEIQASNVNSILNFKYDALGRIVEEELNGKKTIHTYDETLNYHAINYPTSLFVEEFYDGRKQLIELKKNSNSITTFNYDLSGNRTQIDYPEINAIIDLEYTKVNRVKRIKSSPSDFNSFEYGYDEEGNKLFEKNINLSQKSNRYFYDNNYRLIKSTEGILTNEEIPNPQKTFEYTYDSAGNLLEKKEDLIATNYTTNALNQYVSYIKNGVLKNILYDDNGNMIQNDTIEYEYDLNNRLTKINNDNNFVYDPFGRMILGIKNTGDTSFYYYDQRLIIEKHTGQQSNISELVYGDFIDDFIYENNSTDEYYYFKNEIGSITSVMNSANDLIEYYSYSPFGETTFYDINLNSHTESMIGNDILYTGRRIIDVPNNIYDYRRRAYNSNLARFIQRDPIGFESDDVNLYSYVLNNPTNLIDPNGTNPLLKIGVILGVCQALQIPQRINNWINETKTAAKKAQQKVDQGAYCDEIKEENGECNVQNATEAASKAFAPVQQKGIVDGISIACDLPATSCSGSTGRSKPSPGKTNPTAIESSGFDKRGNAKTIGTIIE